MTRPPASEWLRRIVTAEHPRGHWRLLLAIIGISIVAGTVWINSPAYVRGSHTGVGPGYQNLHAVQAASFLQGRLDLPIRTDDVAIYDGRSYSVFPPFPAVVLAPLVAFAGPGSFAPLAAGLLLMTGTAVVLARLLARVDVGQDVIPWIVLAFLFGTGYWMCLCWNWGVWYFAHLVAVGCLLLGFNEAFGRGRGAVVGLCLGLAFLSRQLTLYSGVFACAAVLHTHASAPRSARRRELMKFALAVAGCIAAYLAFNWWRFSDPLDTGYSYIVAGPVFQTRIERFGSFSLAYVPFNFVYLFLQGFHLEFRPLYYLVPTGMDPWGTSLTFASPFVFLAFAAAWTKRLMWSAWTSIALTIVHTLFYNSNGMIQSNANRYSLDFLPVLILLVALGTTRLSAAIWKGTIVYSVILNFIALFLVPAAAWAEALWRSRG